MLAQAANRIAGALYGDDEKRLTPEVLIAAAAKATRLDAKPLADPRLMEALGALTASLQKEAKLSPFGRLAASWDLKRMLATLLILADAEREDATIFTRRLAAPIFIAGLPRSGTPIGSLGAGCSIFRSSSASNSLSFNSSSAWLRACASATPLLRSAS